MFTIKQTECVGFESRWKVKKVSFVKEIQTDPIEYENIACGTSSGVSNNEVQTIPEKDKSIKSIHFQDNDETLAKWLTKIYPMLKQELDKPQIPTNAFDFLFENANDLKSVLDTVIGQRLSRIKVPQNDSEQGQLRICALNWNSTGSTIGLSCCFPHETWCLHENSVYFYTLNQKKIPDVPTLKIATNECVIHLCFHPKLSTIIAGATYSGQILIWNLNNDKANVTVTNLKAHNEFITQISWVTLDVQTTKKIHLVTASTDGYLKVWTFHHSNFTLSIKFSYRIKPPLLGKYQLDGGTNLIDSNKKYMWRSIKSFDFSNSLSDNIFVVATEGGLIVQCSMVAAIEIPTDDLSNEIVMDPSHTYHEPFNGEISTVKFSENHHSDNIFLACSEGPESEIRIYTIAQEEPLKVIFPNEYLQYIHWIPIEEDRFVIGSGPQGQLRIFDLLQSTILYDLNREMSFVTALALSTSTPFNLAVATETGHLELWSVNWKRIVNKLKGGPAFNMVQPNQKVLKFWSIMRNNPLVEETANRFFSIQFTTRKAMILYEKHDDITYELFFTAVPQGYHHMGLGSILAERVLDQMQADGKKAIISCDFLRKFCSLNEQRYKSLIVEPK